ncbi:uncharacterized protein BT62DRAFT_559657 [Guyanagaster necrorhizus]|uniref:Uncharacterized protein n=1 Tax=Guyanagaster necrorhizus TaxID=856835 RepID=A0A9P7VI39_9AGAR|nr:uncharacterized protein BT62DRAFT_559657 [Guyanagaster necrorhizus MCA 3950]KAG7440965.1 hypothetical protein BT62DRAFT_559657 [Guyanagaster necrorhizus MCA 3950]
MLCIESRHPASPMNPIFQTLAYTVPKSIKACLYYSTFPRSFLPSSSAAPSSSLLSSSVIVWPVSRWKCTGLERPHHQHFIQHTYQPSAGADG